MNHVPWLGLNIMSQNKFPIVFKEGGGKWPNTTQWKVPLRWRRRRRLGTQINISRPAAGWAGAGECSPDNDDDDDNDIDFYAAAAQHPSPHLSQRCYENTFPFGCIFRLLEVVICRIRNRYVLAASEHIKGQNRAGRQQQWPLQDPAGLLPSSCPGDCLLPMCGEICCGYWLRSGSGTTAATLPDNGDRFLQFSITVRPPVGTHGQERCECVCVRTHTHALTHSLVLTGPPSQLLDVSPLRGSRFLLLLVCSSSLAAGAANLNHHFALAQ